MSATDLSSQQQVGLIYAEHHTWLQKWLFQKMGNSNDAADLTHDTFVRLMGKIHQECIYNPRAYLTTIASGLVKDFWRHQAVELAWLQILELQPEPVTLSQEEHYILLETLKEISRLLDGLPAKVREIFLYSQLDGFTYPQIAEKIGVSVNVVQKSMCKAMAHCYKAVYLN